MTFSVEERGLKEYRLSVSELAGMSREVRHRAADRCAHEVLDGARPRVDRLTGAAAGSLRVITGQDEAVVQGGGPEAPYYPWLAFGGRVGINNSVSRPKSDGRYVYPVYHELKGRGVFADIAAEEQRDAARQAGLDVVAD